MGRHNSCVSLLVSAKRLVFSALTDVEPEPVAMSDQVQELAPMPIPKGLSVEPDGMERFPINPPPSEVDFPSVGLLDFLDTSCFQALPLPLVSFCCWFCPVPSLLHHHWFHPAPRICITMGLCLLGFAWVSTFLGSA